MSQGKLPAMAGGLTADLTDLIAPEAIRAGVAAANRKSLLLMIGTIAAEQFGLDARDVSDTLMKRERLGSTGFGGGIAMPHGRFAGIDRVVGIFIRLDAPIDFEAVDDLPVDLVFALLSPATSGAAHLKALARVSRLLRDRDFRAKLRGAGSRDALYALLAGVDARDAA